MKTKMKFLIIIIIIVFIIAVIWYVTNKNKSSEAEETENTVVEVQEEEEQNATEEENQNTSESEGMVDNETSYTQIDEAPEGDIVEVTGTDEEKAIALAKNKWGVDDDTVYFTIANTDGNIYYISVNNSETSGVITWYMVDVETGEVSDY